MIENMRVLYEEAKFKFYDLDEYITKSENPLIGDVMYSITTLYFLKDDIKKFLIYVLYVANTKADMIDLKNILNYMENDVMVNDNPIFKEKVIRKC